MLLHAYRCYRGAQKHGLHLWKAINHFCCGASAASYAKHCKTPTSSTARMQRFKVALAALLRRISMLPDGVYVGAGLAAAGLFVKSGVVEAANISKQALSEVPANVKKQYAGMDIRFRAASETGVHLLLDTRLKPPPPLSARESRGRRATDV